VGVVVGAAAWPVKCPAIFSRLASMSESESKPPPPGIYVPAVLFFKEDEELDEEAIKLHTLHLAQVPKLDIYIPLVAPNL
jgi:hypothetical protein